MSSIYTGKTTAITTMGHGAQKENEKHKKEPTCSGSEYKTNPSARTAVLLTSSLTSDTAKCSNWRMALLFAVPL
jgi:hypothetical protein